MSARVYGGTITAPATAASLRTQLVAAEPTVIAVITIPSGASILIRAATANAAVIYFGWGTGAGVTQLTNVGLHAIAFIKADEAVEFHCNTTIHLSSIYIAGNGTDTATIAVVDQ